MRRAAIYKVLQSGLPGIHQFLLRRVKRLFHALRTLGAKEFRNPDADDLQAIEAALSDEGILCGDYVISGKDFDSFKNWAGFPPDYHGGAGGAIYEEKLLEHYVAWDLLNLDTAGKRYLDIAGATSPWVQLLNSKEIEAYSIDLNVPDQFSHQNYYIQGDATATNFPDNYFDAASAQCAFEMFAKDSDIRLMSEISRILKPGGRCVISPLYMHTHACFYQSPEYYGIVKGDAGAKAYIRRDCLGVPVSRKYSARTLNERIFAQARKTGLKPSIYVLRNKREISEKVYLHFILVIEKPSEAD